MGNTHSIAVGHSASTVHRKSAKTGAVARLHKKVAENAVVRPQARKTTTRKSAGVKSGVTSAGCIGSSFDDFLEEEGLLQEVVAAATKRVIAWQLEQVMKQQKISKTTLASRMGTSRAALDRLLDEADTSMTLGSLASAAAALGKSVRVELVQA